MKFCLHCGAKIPSEDAQFCMNCGQKLPKLEPETAAPTFSAPADLPDSNSSASSPAEPAESPEFAAFTGQPLPLSHTPEPEAAADIPKPFEPGPAPASMHSGSPIPKYEGPASTPAPPLDWEMPYTDSTSEPEPERPARQPEDPAKQTAPFFAPPKPAPAPPLNESKLPVQETAPSPHTKSNQPPSPPVQDQVTKEDLHSLLEQATTPKKLAKRPMPKTSGVVDPARRASVAPADKRPAPRPSAVKAEPFSPDEPNSADDPAFAETVEFSAPPKRKAALFDQDNEPVLEKPAPKAPLFDQDEGEEAFAPKADIEDNFLTKNTVSKPFSKEEPDDLFGQEPDAPSLFDDDSAPSSGLFDEEDDWSEQDQQPMPLRQDMFADTSTYKAAVFENIANAAMQPGDGFEEEEPDSFSEFPQDNYAPGMDGVDPEDGTRGYSPAARPSFERVGKPVPRRGGQPASQPQPPAPAEYADYQHDDYAPAKRKKGMPAPIKLLLGIIVFAVVTLGITIGVLSFLNRPGKAISDFTIAMANDKYDALEKGVALSGTRAQGEDWAPLCNAFKDSVMQEALREELETKADGEPLATPQFPAINISSSNLFLFINRYTITAEAVDLLLPEAQEGTLLRLDGEDRSGTLTPEGLLVPGVMPGQYTCQVIGADGSVSDPFELLAFETAAANWVNPAAVSGSTVIIDNCASDDATLYVNNVEVPQKPSGGIVTIPSVQLNSEIRILVVQEGEATESIVVFNDSERTQLRFESYTPVGSEEPETPEDPEASPTEIGQGEIDTIIAAFYNSYLECVNAQDISSLANATGGLRDRMSEEMKSEANRTNNFAFTGAACDAGTITMGEENDTPTATFDASFSFKYWPKEGGSEESAESAQNNRSVQLIYSDGQWLVNQFNRK